MISILSPAIIPLLHLLFVFASTSNGYSYSAGSRFSGPTSTTNLHAGLRDLVGLYDNDEYGAAAGPYIAPSIRDERNSVLRNDRSFGSGGYASGGTGGVVDGGGFGRRNSPGFIGFRGDRNYPAYDVVIDTPVRGGGGSRSSSSTRRSARIFDNVDFDELPASSTRRINNSNNFFGPPLFNDNGLVRSTSDPYNRGLNSDFINTNGSPQRRRGGRDTNSIGEYYDEFDALPKRGGFRGRGNNVPQIYRRDLIDDGILDGRYFNSLTPVEQYFEAWNRRNIPLALSCFDDDVYYDDLNTIQILTYI